MVLESHRNPCNSSSSSSIYCSRLSISTESVVIVIDKPGIYFSGAETRLAARLGRRRTAEHFRPSPAAFSEPGRSTFDSSTTIPHQAFRRYLFQSVRT